MKKLIAFVLIISACNNHKPLSKEQEIDSIAKKQRILIDSITSLPPFDDSLLKAIRLELITYDSIHHITRESDYYISHSKIILNHKIDSLKALRLYPTQKNKY